MLDILWDIGYNHPRLADVAQRATQTATMLERYSGEAFSSGPLSEKLTLVPVIQEEDQRSSVREEFVRLAQHPPGNDPYMGAFYEAVADLDQHDAGVEQFITQVLQKRSSITPTHFANLIYRGVQFIELFQKRNIAYPAVFDTPGAWKLELADILEQEGPVLRELLLTKDTTSTIYQRYLGARTILASFYPNRSLTIADFGCGGNYGLRGLALSEPFKPVVDRTPGQVVTQLLRQPLVVGSGLAIDRENPLDEDITRWRLACSFYPQELGQMADVIALEKRLAQDRTVRFFKGDLLTLPVGSAEIPAGQCDGVVVSTLCYQLPQADQDTIMEHAGRMIKPGGLVIVQDFAEKDKSDPARLHFIVDWFKHPYSYRNFITGPRTNWEMKEILRWKNGRCEEVMPGEDFSSIEPPLSPLYQAAA